MRAAASARENVYRLLKSSSAEFVLGNDFDAASSLINHLQEGLLQINLCGESELLAVGTALLEALFNAIERGNLELDPDDPANLMQNQGRGSQLIQTFMDRVTFNETGNEITLHLDAVSTVVND